jgi:predicted MPP superfamily phosphohydrolase
MIIKNKNKLFHIRYIIITFLTVTILVHLIHGVTLDRMIVYEEITFTSSSIPVELDGYTIVFLTDIHADSGRRLHGIVEELSERQIDLLLLGGDFTYEKEDVQTTMELISQINTVDGAFGIEGNHDDYQLLFPMMKQYGITPLSNNGMYIHDNFFLAGVEDLWNRNPDISKAIEGAGEESFIILLTHNPDVTMTQDTPKIDLILSGHTHGGQLNLFGRISIGLDTRVISDYGTRFKGGWATSQDGTPVYVSKGIGEYYPRIFARPEVTIITLNHQE